MKNFTKLICVVCAVIFSLLASPVRASHFKGGDTYFVCQGNGYYKIVFACYYACEPSSSAPYAPSSMIFHITSSCATVPTTLTCVSATPQQDVPLYCPGVRTSCDYGYPYSLAPAGAPTGTLVIVYATDSFLIPPGCTVTAEIANGNRNAAITNLVNPSNTYLDIACAITTPLDGTCNNNPQFAQYPVNVFCLNQNANFSQGAIDFSGDSLVYTLINPRDNNGAPIPFVNGCSPANPLGAPTGFASVFSFNSATGNINFTPTQSGNYVLTVQVTAYHNGVLVGSTMRDIQFTVTPCNNPPAPALTSLLNTNNVIGGVVIDSNHVGVCPGEQLTINLTATVSTANNYIIDSTNAAQSLPGAIISVTHKGTAFDTAVLHITWTPQNSDSGYHYILVTVKDTICPLPGRQTYAFLISVLTGLYAGPNLVYCNGGQPVTIYAKGANHYIWTDSATGGPPVGLISYAPDSSYIVVAPGVTSGYIVRGDLLGTCKNLDTVKVVNAPLFALTSGVRDTSICKYNYTVIHTTPSPASVGPYTYAWSPASSVVSPYAGTTNTQPLLVSTVFTVTATAVGGCAITDSVRVDINGAAPKVTIIPSNNNVCPGDTITLNSAVFAENLVLCGLVDTCVSNNILFNVAVSNDTTTTTGSPFGFTSVNGSPFMGGYNSYKVQYLFTRAELNAAGLSSGSITDLAFFVKQINSTAAYDTFAISMGCTNVDSLTAFVNNLQEVVPPQYGANAVYPNLGYTPFPFTHYYNWDGASNLVVQVCYTIPPTVNSQNDFVSYSTTSYMGSSITAGDYGFFGNPPNGCSLSNGANFYSINKTRANIKFGMCAPNVLQYSWTPATLVCDTCPTTRVVVNKDSTYTLSVSANHCVNNISLRLQVNPYLANTALPDTTICFGDSLQLRLSLTNPAPVECVSNYTVAPIPYSPINGTATLVAPAEFISSQGFTYSTDDGTAGPYQVGFSFPFYCRSYNQFFINSNGWITFEYPYPATANVQEYTAQTFPPSATDLNPQKVIELMMGNYYLSNGFGSGGGFADYFLTGTAPNRILVVQYNNMADVTGSYATTGEIHLHETSGVVDILIGLSNYSGTNHTTGVKDSTGLGTAAPNRNNRPYTVTRGEAWRFTPVFAPSTVIGTSIWSPNVYLNNDSIPNPVTHTPGSQTYYVNGSVLINQFTQPEYCPVHDTVRVNIDTFRHTLTASQLTVCPGDTVQLRFTSHTDTTIASYKWVKPFGLSSAVIDTPFAVVLDTTTYHVTVTDNFRCRVLDSITINTYIVPRPQMGPDSMVCYTDSVLLHLAGSYTNYQWFLIDTVTGARVLVSSGPNAASYYAHPTHSYILRVTPTVGQCSYFTNIVNVDSFPKLPLLIDTFGQLQFCVGAHVVLEAQQGVTSIQWIPSSYGSQASFPVTTAGTFYYSARDQYQCLLHSDTVTTVANPVPVFILNTFKNPICITDVDTLVAGSSPSGASITWAGQTVGDTLITSAPGTYSVEASLLGCINDTSIIISGAASPVVTLAHDTSECSCTPAAVVIATTTGGTPGYAFKWSNGGNGPSTIDSILGPYLYTVTVTDFNNCSAVSNTQTITMRCPLVSIAVLPLTDTVFIHDTATFTATPQVAGTNLTYSWTSATTATVLNPALNSTNVIGDSLGTDTVNLTVTDPASGCSYSTFAVITVIDFGAFKMPTAFTPNGDGKNDDFYPALNGPNSPAKVTAFRIYSRWGQLVYDNPSPPGWNGNYGGTQQPGETYMYFVTVEYPNPANPSKTLQKSVEGSFQLLR
jgi:gliding motility-associated-like protein